MVFDREDDTIKNESSHPKKTRTLLIKITVFSGIVLFLSVLTWAFQSIPKGLPVIGDNGWKYAWGNADGHLLADVWEPLDRFPQTAPNRDGRSWLFLQSSLPSSIGKRDALWIGRTFFNYEIYIEDQLVLSRGITNGKPDKYFPGFRWQFLTVDPAWAGKLITIRCFSSGFYIGPVQPVCFAPRDIVLAHIFRAEILPFGAAMFFLIIGVVIVIFSAANGDIVGAFYIGWLMISTAIYTVRFLEIRFFILDLPYIWDAIGLYVTLLFTYLFSVFFDRLFRLKASRLFRWNLYISVLFLILGAMLIILIAISRICFILPDLTNLGIGLRTVHQYHIITSFLLLLFLIFKRAREGNEYASDMALGLVFFFMFSLPSVLHALGIGMTTLPKMIDVGMVFFLGTGIYVASKKYYDTYRAYRHYLLSGMETDGSMVTIKDRQFEIEDVNAYAFTKREVEVIQKSMLGKKNREIADKLGIAERTVKQHLTNIFEKADVSSKLELFHEITKNIPTAN